MLRFNVPADTLKKMYLQQNLSLNKIATYYGCSRQTISNYLVIYNIAHKTKAQSRIKYNNRRKFDGSLEGKAYLIGFRLGDLNVYKPYESSETIVARCHSTNIEQVNLIQEIFSPYGRVKSSQSRHGYAINCYLDLSFNFLLKKSDKVEEWIGKSKESALAFIAGYVDAEGSFQINQGKGRLAIAACDRYILLFIQNFLMSIDIKSTYRKIADKGTKSVGNCFFSKDVWRVNINEAHSLRQFINLIKPYLKHKKRLNDMNKVVLNIKMREEKGSI